MMAFEVISLRQTILYIAISLDGMIAGVNDDLSYLHGYDDFKLVQSSYQELINQIDTIIMGRRTYDVVLNMGDWPYEGYQTYVITSNIIPSSHANLTSLSPKTLIETLRKENGKDIWIVGGAKLVQSLLKDDLIDSMVIAIIPTLLGEGTRLFEGVQASFDCIRVEHEKGLILATYQRKKGR
jgi:dihydrofolate reductase